MADNPGCTERESTVLLSDTGSSTHTLLRVGTLTNLLDFGYRKCGACSISRLALSICPLDSGWYPEVRLTVTPSFSMKPAPILEENWGPVHSQYLQE